MLTRAIRIGTLTFVGLCMAATACTVDDGERPEDWTLPGDVRDAPSDSGEPDGSVFDGGRDASDVQDTTDIRDTSDVAPLDCTCAVEGATCKRVDQRAMCVVDGAECDFDVHGAECRPECTDHADCGQKQYCNVNDRCFPRRKCDYEGNHALCPPGFWCDEEYDSDSTCRRSGGKPVGASCEKDWECKSGGCGGGRCFQTCFAEEDCPGSDRACGLFNDGYALLGCYEPHVDEPDCEISCPEDQLCDGKRCRPHACHRTAQCPESDCILSPRGLENEGLGQCTGKERRCDGWEFRIAADDPFCRLGIDCDNKYNPEHFSCPEGYECIQGEPDRGRELYTSWCSRRMTDGEWPPE